MQQIKAGWRDEGLEEAVAIVGAMPEVNAVLERESALLAQNLVSAITSANHENEVAALANNTTKEALCRSFLTGLQGSAEQITKLRAAMQEACDLLAERKHGSPARSPGHNARLCLEWALSSGERQDG